MVKVMVKVKVKVKFKVKLIIGMVLGTQITFHEYLVRLGGAGPSEQAIFKKVKGQGQGHGLWSRSW